jgi:hypothetical protein
MMVPLEGGVILDLTPCSMVKCTDVSEYQAASIITIRGTICFFLGSTVWVMLCVWVALVVSPSQPEGTTTYRRCSRFLTFTL